MIWVSLRITEVSGGYTKKKICCLNGLGTDRNSLLLVLFIDGCTATVTAALASAHAASPAAGTMVPIAVVPDEDQCRQSDDCHHYDTDDHRCYGHCDPSLPATFLTIARGSFTMMKYANTTADTIAMIRYATLMSAPIRSPPNCTRMSEHTYANTHW